MKKFILCIVAISILPYTAFCCDMCGSSPNGQYIGMLPAFYRNIAGFRYVSGRNSGVIPSAYSNVPGAYTNEYNNTFSLWCRQRIGRRNQVFVFLPYQYNVTDKAGAGRQSFDGAGDVTVLVNRVLLDVDSAEWKHTFFGGVGIKLPTGKYTSYTAASDLVSLRATGTGSYDFIANGNYTARHGKMALNIDAAYTVTTAASDKYKYGNGINTGLAVLYVAALGKVGVVPQIAVRGEYAATDYYNYSKNWVNSASGGYVLLGGAGLQITYKGLGARLLCHLPVTQHYPGRDIASNYRLETGLFILY